MTEVVSPRPIGYRRKPVWILAVAWLFILWPAFNLSWLMISFGEPEWYKPSVWFNWLENLPRLVIFFMVLLCACGMALLFVRRWSWWFNLAALAGLGIYSLYMASQSLDQDPFLLSLLGVGTLGFLCVLYMSEFKKPFIDKSLRWWESKPRFQVRVPVHVIEMGQDLILVNISKSGLLLEWPEGEPHREVPGQFLVEINNELRLPCALTRAGERRVGAKILKLEGEQRKHLDHWIKLLSKSPVHRAR
jgi:hypothetical protein